MKISRLVPLTLFSLFLFSDQSSAQQFATADINLSEDDIYQASLKALSVFLVVAILIENALALLFGWQVFRAYFSLGGLKSVISFAVALIVVKQFQLDVLASLLMVYGDAETVRPSSLMTEVLSALIIAGGSAGVHNVMRALGYRDNDSLQMNAPSVDRAWIAVHVDRKSGTGPLQIAITEEEVTSSKQLAIAGTIFAHRPTLRSLLIANKDRFPSNGGYEVEPGKTYRISVVGTDHLGHQKIVDVSNEPLQFAPRALVDFDVIF